MKFYIDFEATQPENEIIAIGAVAENGAEFYSLVKPQLSSISNYVSQLTHISEAALNQAQTIDEVMVAFDLWMMNQESDIMKCDILSYGDDSTFVKATLPAVKDPHAFCVMACLMAKIKDCSKEVFKFFNGGISLINAFNYVQEAESKQKHNPLEDAIMLQKVYEHTKTHEPLEHHPNSITETAKMKMPSGAFWCKQKGKNQKIYRFDCIEDAIEWLITNVMHARDPEEVHRDRVMAHIMKAIRTSSKYCNFVWHRGEV